VFNQLANTLEPSVKFFGLIGETEPGFIGAALIAAGISGFQLESIAIRPEENQAQIIWRTENNREVFPIVTSSPDGGVRSAIKYLEFSGEPECYLLTISAAFIGILKSWSVSAVKSDTNQKDGVDSPVRMNRSVEPDAPSPSTIYTSVYNSARDAFNYRSGFLRFNPQDLPTLESNQKNLGSQSSLFSLESGTNSFIEDDSEAPEAIPDDIESHSGKEKPTRSSDISISTIVWLRETKGADRIPMTDRYELSLVSYLLNHPGCSIQAIDRAMCEAYPGLFTPPIEFIHLCMDSYGIQEPALTNQWYLRLEDDPVQRLSDLDRVTKSIHLIGERLGYKILVNDINSNLTNITWLDKISQLTYSFYPLVSAAVGEIVINYNEKPPARGFIVIPGSRANLLAYKLQRDPRLAKAFNLTQGNWKFLKFRHLRSLIESPFLSRENLDQLLSLDPITYTTPQLWLI
jgi:hypothetical protein